ncbi:MAG: hypothetical protein KC776_34180 [Myxococcales bacterium]|nr:hypothetical protein [Myxococcales bacterium]MCB9583539.1 hypothetical protein [Polyangiaceae bacterium]
MSNLVAESEECTPRAGAKLVVGVLAEGSHDGSIVVRVPRLRLEPEGQVDAVLQRHGPALDRYFVVV